MTKSQKTKADRKLRRENIIRAIELSYSSLHSHLHGCVRQKKSSVVGNPEFQAKCVAEYSFVIFVLSRELHALTKRDYREAYEAK